MLVVRRLFKVLKSKKLSRAENRVMNFDESRNSSREKGSVFFSVRVFNHE